MPKGRTLRIPASRSLVCDVLRLDRLVPSCAHDRVFELGALTDARTCTDVRVSWPAIFMKAYALTAREFPRLRQTWMTLPWSHLYEHHEQVGTLVVHRRFENDDWLFWGQISNIDARPVSDIQAAIDRFQTDPVEQIFKRQVWLSRRSPAFRRFAWWLTFQPSGKKRCKRLGTFFLSTISGLGAEIQEPPSMLTSGFTYGPMDDQGRTRVTITYDHRLLDGHHVANILVAFERTMQTVMLDEVSALQSSRSAA